MTLYTSEVVAQHLDVTERRVRQLRDEGIIREKRPGLYNLVDAMTRYIKYVNAGSKVDLNDERAKLTKVKREAAEMENRVRKAELMEVGDVEKAYSTVMMNFAPASLPCRKSWLLRWRRWKATSSRYKTLSKQSWKRLWKL